MSSGLESRVVELETRLAFQEHALSELSDALADARRELSRNDALLRRALDELHANRPGVTGDPADEPPPPHY
ncbi:MULTISPECIES: SlyX family protein [unclassified Luteimonas]